MELRLNDQLNKGRFTISGGDIFEVPLKNGFRMYFQFIYKDDSYLAGHLIRGFEYKAAKDDSFSLHDITRHGIKFYTHTRVFEGLKEGFWTKLGNVPIEADFDPPTFVTTADTIAYVKKSFEWYIWKGDFTKAKKLGALPEKYKDFPISALFPPSDIVEWFENGWHGFRQPE